MAPYLTEDEVDRLFVAYSSCSRENAHHVGNIKAGGKHRKRKTSPKIGRTVATAAAAESSAEEKDTMCPFKPQGKFVNYARTAKDEVECDEGQKAAQRANFSVYTHVSHGVMYVVTEGMT